MIGEHKRNSSANQKEMQRLSALGFNFQINSKGYRLLYNDEFVFAAGTISTARLHWRHAEANINMYSYQAILKAQERLTKGPTQ